MNKTVPYEQDIVAWANEQARLLRAGRLDLLDIEHLAEEIEDVGKSEQRELASRMVVLLAHLLKWQYQPEYRGNSWRLTLRNQRRAIQRRLDQTPSLHTRLQDNHWWQDVWEEAVTQALHETGLDPEQKHLPETCPWTAGEILAEDWLPAA